MPSIKRPLRFRHRTTTALLGASLLGLTGAAFAQTAPQVPAPPASAPAKTPEPDAAAAKRTADRAAFFDARVAAVHAGLQLTPDQEKLWPPVDGAIHDLAAVMRKEREMSRDEGRPANPVEGLQRLSERTYARGTALKRLSDAVTPLYASLSGDQKDRLPTLMRGMGMSQRMGPGEQMGRRLGGERGREFSRGDEPGMEGDGRPERGPMFGGDEDRGGWRRGRDARGGWGERAEGRSGSDAFGLFDGGRRHDDERRDRDADD